MNEIKYEYHCDIELLEQEVNKLLADGWQILSPLMESNNEYIQPLIRYLEDKISIDLNKQTLEETIREINEGIRVRQKNED